MAKSVSGSASASASTGAAATSTAFTIDSEGNVLQDGKPFLDAGTFGALLMTAQAQGRIIVISTQDDLAALGSSTKKLLAEAAAGNAEGVVEAVGGVVEHSCSLVGLRNLPTVDKTGAPQVAGLADAGEAVCDVIVKRGRPLGMDHFDLDVTKKRIGNVRTWHALGNIFAAGQEKVSRNLVPESKDLKFTVTTVCDALSPMFETNAELVNDLEEPISYCGDRYQKAVQTRKHNQRKQAHQKAQIQGQVAAQAREQVRGEFEQRITDRLGTILGEDPTPKK